MTEATREVFLEQCKALAVNETPEDVESLKSFLNSKPGMLAIGRMELLCERLSVVGPMGISPKDPYACAAQLAELQGKIRGICLCIDRLLGDNGE